MSTRSITWWLMNGLKRDGKGTCLPCFTPRCWFEADVALLTDAGYFVEYEVKTSRSDFLADRRKGGFAFQNGLDHGQTKHQRLAAGDPQGPSRFYFVTLGGIVTAEDIPPWAGWIEARQDDRRQPNCWSLWPMKKARQLHRVKPEALAEDMHKVYYYRMHTAFDKVEELTNQLKHRMTTVVQPSVLVPPG